MSYLLDPNILSAPLRRPSGLQHRFVQHAGRQRLCQGMRPTPRRTSTTRDRRGCPGPADCVRRLVVRLDRGHSQHEGLRENPRPAGGGLAEAVKLSTCFRSSRATRCPFQGNPGDRKYVMFFVSDRGYDHGLSSLNGQRTMYWHPRRSPASGSGYVATNKRPPRTTVIPDA